MFYMLHHLSFRISHWPSVQDTTKSHPPKLWIWFITVDVDLDDLAGIAIASFLQCKVTFLHFHIVPFGKRKVTVFSPYFRNGELLSPSLGYHSYIISLQFFYMGDFFSTSLTNLFNNFHQYWIHEYLFYNLDYNLLLLLGAFSFDLCVSMIYPINVCENMCIWELYILTQKNAPGLTCTFHPYSWNQPFLQTSLFPFSGKWY